MNTLRAKIPEIYHAFFPDFLDWEVPEERIATCDNCTICQSDKSPYLDTKCCSYFPQLPNYLVGGLLQDEDPAWAEGRRRIRELIAQKVGVSPYGVLPPVTYMKRFQSPDRMLRFETREDANALLCPYYDHGRCSVWKYRENLCVTFFCVSVGGQYGKKFWKKLNNYLKLAESNLSKYAMLELGFPPEQIALEIPKGEKLGLDDAEGQFHPEKHQQIWGQWLDQEEDFYIRCYQLVRQMDQERFQRLSGMAHDILYRALENTHREFLASVVPEYILFNPEVSIRQLPNGDYELASDADTHTVEGIYLMMLRAFDGQRTTTEVYHQAYQVLLSLGNLVAVLYRKRILIAAR